MKYSISKDTADVLSGSRWSSRWSLRLGALIGIVAIASGLMAFYLPPLADSYWFRHPRVREYPLGKFLDLILSRVALIQSYPKGVARFVHARIFNTMPVLSLDIGMEQSLDLEASRLLRVAGKRDARSVRASMSLGKVTVPVELEIKGDRMVHFSDPRNISLRVKLHGDDVLFGTREFSLQRPVVRNYVWEWLNLELMRSEGVIAPGYQFVKLVVNGDNRGTFAVEEHYTKYLVERSEYRDGPIVAFDEDSPDGDIRQVKLFNSNHWRTKENEAVAEAALMLLNGFVRGQYSVDEVFDTEQLATFFALSDLMQTHHGTLAKSVRYYYNPITQKLHPIPFDGHSARLASDQFTLSLNLATDAVNNWIFATNFRWYRRFFNTIGNDRFLTAYRERLERYSNRPYIEAFFSKQGDALDAALSAIYYDFPLKDGVGHLGPMPFPFDFSRNDVYSNQSLLRSALQKMNVFYSAERIGGGEHVIKVVNRDIVPVGGFSYGCKGGASYHSPAKSVSLYPAQNYETDSEVVTLRFAGVPPELKGKDCALFYTYQGRNSVRKATSIAFVPNIREVAASPPLAKPMPAFVTHDAKAREFKIASGIWNLHSDLIIPAGEALTVEPGTTIILHQGASIVSYSPVKLVGSAKNKIIFFSPTNEGGVAVVNAGGASKLDYVQFKYLGVAQQGTSRFSGTLNFYQSPVTISNTLFTNLRAEDSVNFVRSNFEVTASEFNHVSSDAIDSDFSEGKVTYTSFRNVGNDALDLSGSKVSIVGVKMVSVGDKAVSAGERSRVTIENYAMEDVEIGIASKDASEVKARNGLIRNAKVGLVAFNKKREFSGSVLTSDGATITATLNPYIAEHGALVVIDGVQVRQDAEAVKKLLYGNLYGKSSR